MPFSAIPGQALGRPWTEARGWPGGPLSPVFSSIPHCSGWFHFFSSPPGPFKGLPSLRLHLRPVGFAARPDDVFRLADGILAIPNFRVGPLSSRRSLSEHLWELDLHALEEFLFIFARLFGK
jgi:hypothetical protein